MTLRFWLWLLALGVVAYSIAVLLMFLSQDESLYPATTYPPDYAAALSQREGLAPWPADAVVPKAYLSEPTAGAVRGTVIVFHGNGGAALDRGYYASALNQLGYRVLLAEYPGYGARPGSYGESSFVPDALDVFDRARIEFGAPLYVLGESLGAGVASAIARDRGEAVAGVALVTPWDSLPDVAQEKYPLFPTRFVMKSRFDNVANLASYRGPKAVAMALADEIIPNAHTRRLYESLPEPKRLWEFEGAGHNSWPSDPSEAWWSEVMSFLAQSEGES